MTITHELTLDLKHKGELAHIEVVQGDAFTRQVDLMLQCGGEDWTIPVCDPVVRYCKPDGTGGIYDTLPDGQPAIVYAGNVLTLALAPQMLTCSGPVQVQVELNTQEKRLATFAFLVVVEPGVAPNRESEDYVNWNKAFLLQSTGAKAGQYLRISAVDADGRITEVEAADAPSEGAMEMALSARDLAQASDEKSNTALRIAQDVAQEMEDYSPSGTRSIAEAAMRMADQRIIAPEQAAAGQYVRVAAVDADGKIIATETVDAPVGIPEGTVSNGGRFLGEITLSEDVNGTIIIPLNDNPFLYGKLLIEMNAQLVNNGDGQYMGTIFGGTKKSSIFHLNTLFSADKTSTVWVMVDLFRDMVHSIATKKGDYMWLTNVQYSYAYEIDQAQNAADNMLEISWCSAVSGATFKVWGE